MTTLADLAAELRQLYTNAPKGKRVTAIHYFAISQAEAIKMVSKVDLLARAGLSVKYATELSKGIHLADYVLIKKPLT